MDAGLIVFFFLAVVAVAAAVGMLFSRNAVYAALFLVVHFTTIAVIYLTLGAPFIALVQITVYAGAIMVLFLFVIMLLGVEKLPIRETIPWHRPLAITLAVALLGELIYVNVAKTGLVVQIGYPQQNFGSPTVIGVELFNKYMLPFEITSVILIVAVIGAVVLTRVEKIRRPKGEEKESSPSGREA